jgi:hypothetical protein
MLIDFLLFALNPMQVLGKTHIILLVLHLNQEKEVLENLRQVAK